MCRQPFILPSNYNLLPLIWTYAIKPDGAKKSRCTCNGSPHQKGTITLVVAHAASLEQSGGRIFWALASLIGCQVHSADATNAFAEAPSPIASLHVTIY